MARQSSIIQTASFFDLEEMAKPETSKKEEEEKIFTVSQFLDFVNEILTPQRAIVKGEIGRIDNRGHFLFFTLLDSQAEAMLNCFLWKDRLKRVGVELAEGIEITVEGFPNIYKRTGRFTFEVERLGLVGEGALKIAFERLKRQLSQKGFFALERKRSIPAYPVNIALITSQFADAKKDFLTHLGNFGFKIYFYDVRVEGIYAIEEIVSAIRYFNESTVDLDTLVLTRGGGSLESLQAFNSLEVARAVFSSRIPVITGIGHENDVTIADLVADYYASTPTHAARVLSDSWRNTKQVISAVEQNMAAVFGGKVATMKETLSAYQGQLTARFEKTLAAKTYHLTHLNQVFISSLQLFFTTMERIERTFIENWERLARVFSKLLSDVTFKKHQFEHESKRWLTCQTKKINEIENRLKLAHPTTRLRQGYSIVFNRQGKVIKSSQQTKVGELLETLFYQGSTKSRVEMIKS